MLSQLPSHAIFAFTYPIFTNQVLLFCFCSIGKGLAKIIPEMHESSNVLRNLATVSRKSSWHLLVIINYSLATNQVFFLCLSLLFINMFFRFRAGLFLNICKHLVRFRLDLFGPDDNVWQSTAFVQLVIHFYLVLLLHDLIKKRWMHSGWLLLTVISTKSRHVSVSQTQQHRRGLRLHVSHVRHL